jgi:hypothetical protein
MLALDDNYDTWSLKPRLGLGDIQFGMTRIDVESFAQSIGGISRERAGDDLAEHARESQRAFAGLLEPEDIAAALESMREAAPLQSNLLTEHRGSGLILDYRDGRLCEMIAPKLCYRLSVGGVRLFGVPPLAAIAAVRQTTGEAPLINRSFVMFPGSLVVLCDFVRQDGQGGIEVAGEGSEDFDEMSVSWRSHPYGPDEDWSGFEPLHLP